MGDHCNNIWFIKRYEGYKKLKTQNVKIKDELTPTAWHPSRWWCWCVPEDEKKRDRKIVGININLFMFGDRIQKIF